MDKYVIRKTRFLGSWSVVSPPVFVDYGAGPTFSQEGETFDSLPECMAWMDAHATQQFEKFFYTHTAAEPAI